MLTLDGMRHGDSMRRKYSLRRRGSWAAWHCCAALLLLSAAGFAQAPDLSKMDVVLRSVPDGPIARVNGVSIPSAVFVDLYSDELARYENATSAKLSDGKRVELALLCMIELVEAELLYQEALARQIDVPRDTAEKAFDAQIKRLNSREAELIERHGFSSREEALQDIERLLLIKRVSEQIVEEHGVEVTDAEIKEKYEQQKDKLTQPEWLSIRHMFFRAGGQDAKVLKDRARQRAKSAMALLRSGQRFEAVWESSSDRMNPGDTGILRGPIGKLPQFLVDEAMKLEPGRTSGVIESKAGYHIIQMVEFIPGKEADREKSKPLLRSAIYSQKANDVIRDFVWELIDGVADVQNFLELESNVALAERGRD